MRFFLIISFIFISQAVAFSQLVTKTNERVYGGSGDDGSLNSVFKHGNFTYIVGQSDSQISGDKSNVNFGFSDSWILKLDQNNNIIWDLTIGGDKPDEGFGAIKMSDRIILSSISFSDISGNKTSANNGPEFTNDAWLVCIDLDGNVLWQENYGGSNGENYLSMVVTPQNTLFLAMLSESDVSGNKTEATPGVRDIWLLEIDPEDGAIIRQKSLASDKLSDFSRLFVNEQNEVYLTFHAAPGVNGVKTDPGFGFNTCLLVLNSDWSIKNQKCFGSAYGGTGYNLQAIAYEYENHVYLSCIHGPFDSLIGNKTSPSFNNSADLWLVKMDLDLNIIWDKSYGGAQVESGRITSIKNDRIYLNMQSETSAIQAGNKVNLGYGLVDALFMELDLDGNILNQKTIGGSGDDYGSINFLNDNQSDKAYFCASSNSPISGLKSLPSKGGFDIWFFEVELSELLSVPEPVGFGVVEVYPNPTTDAVTFSLPENTKNIQLKLYTAEGKLVYEDVILANEQHKTISLNAWNGVLFYTLESETTALSGKLVKM